MSELFLADAAVRIYADTKSTRFRETLLAEVRASIKAAETIAKVRVTASSVAATGAATAAREETTAAIQTTAAIKQQNVATTELNTTKQQQALFTRQATQAEAAYGVAAQKTVLAENAGATAVSATAAARAKYSASIRANIAADAAWRASLVTGNAELVRANASLFSRTAALQAAAAAELKDAEAKAINTQATRASAAAEAARTSQVTRGGLATALSLAGVRGATLAASSSFLIGAAAAVAFFKSVQLASNLESELNVLRVTAGATADEMVQVSEAARQLGADVTLPAVSAGDAAQAMTELSKAGLDVQDSIDGARGVLQLATAAQLDNATATNIAASALNAFGLAGDQAVRVADVLANAANDAQGDIGEMGIALQQAAAVGRQAGLSLEQTVSVLTLFARNGLRGSDAGTSFRTALIRLINPTDKAAGVIKQLNLQIRDSAGNIDLGVFDQFVQATSKMTRAQRDQALAIIFGQDAIRGAAILAREGAAGLDAQTEALGKSGTAAEVASARMAGLAGSVENLKNQLSTTGTAIGDLTKGPLTEFVNVMAGGFQNINTFIGFLNRITGEGDKTKQTFAELAAEAGKYNAAVAAREGDAGEGLLERTKELNKALQDSLGPGVAATSMIEDYKAALSAAAQQSESLANRIDEGTDRFARTVVPVEPQGPIPIGPTARLDAAQALASAKGDLDELARLQKLALDRARAAFNNSKGNIERRTELFEAMSAAEASLVSTQNRIIEKARSDRDKAITERERKAREAERRQRESDQRVFDSFLPGQSRINLAAISARASEGLKDDLALQVLIANTASREIGIIDKTVKDVKARNAAVAARVEILKAAQAEADRLRQEIADAVTERRRTAAEERTEALGKAITLAGLRENEAAELAAINAAIANAQSRVKNYKKLGTKLVDEKIALEELINQRDELQNKAKDAQQGTTAFDLLKQFSDTFKQNAGNLINAAQPFAGPTGFTADIAQFLVRRPQPQAPPSTAPAKTRFEMNDDRLVRSIDRLADVIERTSGNVSTGGGANVPISQRKRQRLFWEAHQTRMALEAGTT